MRDEHTVRSNDLIHGLRDIGLVDSDVLMFHSSLKSFGWVAGGANTIIDCALTAVGPRGTVVVPTLSQFVNGQKASLPERHATWDIDTSPSSVGHITQVFRHRPGAVRSDHYTISLTAIGTEATTAMAGHRRAQGRPMPWDDKAYGHGSPWDWLVARNALYLLMGVDFNVCTMFHYCQALWVEAKHGRQSQELTLPRFDFRAMGDRLQAAGLVQQTTVGKSVWRAFRAAPGVQAVLALLRDEPSLFTEEPFQPFGC